MNKFDWLFVACGASLAVNMLTMFVVVAIWERTKRMEETK